MHCKWTYLHKHAFTSNLFYLRFVYIANPLLDFKNTLWYCTMGNLGPKLKSLFGQFGTQAKVLFGQFGTQAKVPS